MIWVAVVGGIALMGFVAVAVAAVMLMRKAEDVVAEVDVVRARLDELMGLIGQLKLPLRPRD